MKFNLFVLIILLMFSITSCSTTPLENIEYSYKIKFNLDEFDHDGLYGPDGGLRSLDYEFCIPKDDSSAAKIKLIDPSIKIYDNSPGRVKCDDNQYLCIGNTYQVGWKSKLLKLASFDFVREIRKTDFE